MNDDFLIRFHKPPRAEFAADLYRKINQPVPAPARSSAVVRLALAAAALCAAFAVTLWVSPVARAAVLSLLRDIGGVSFVETADYPGSGNLPTAPEKTMSLADARAALPFSFNLPAWVPEGFRINETARITRFSEEFTPVTITWRGPAADGQDTFIELMIGQTVGQWIIGPESAETVEINGQPAALVRGAWNADTQQWDQDVEFFQANLIWAKGDTTYYLSSPRVSAEDLIRMAESIP